MTVYAAKRIIQSSFNGTTCNAVFPKNSLTTYSVMVLRGRLSWLSISFIVTLNVCICFASYHNSGMHFLTIITYSLNVYIYILKYKLETYLALSPTNKLLYHHSSACNSSFYEQHMVC